jgi:hypothetical protein
VFRRTPPSSPHTSRRAESKTPVATGSSDQVTSSIPSSSTTPQVSSNRQRSSSQVKPRTPPQQTTPPSSPQVPTRVTPSADNARSSPRTPTKQSPETTVDSPKTPPFQRQHRSLGARESPVSAKNDKALNIRPTTPHMRAQSPFHMFTAKTPRARAHSLRVSNGPSEELEPLSVSLKSTTSSFNVSQTDTTSLTTSERSLDGSVYTQNPQQSAHSSVVQYANKASPGYTWLSQLQHFLRPQISPQQSMDTLLVDTISCVSKWRGNVVSALEVALPQSSLAHTVIWTCPTSPQDEESQISAIVDCISHEVTTAACSSGVLHSRIASPEHNDLDASDRPQSCEPRVESHINSRQLTLFSFAQSDKLEDLLSASTLTILQILQTILPKYVCGSLDTNALMEYDITSSLTSA